MIALSIFDLALLANLITEAPPVTACSVVGIPNGGGDTFDCYTPTITVYSLPNEGTGWSGAWVLGNSPFGYIYGDSFEAYTPGHVALMNADESFNGGELSAFNGLQWFTEDERIFGDSFDTEIVGTFSGGGGTGFSGVWM